MPSFVTQDPDRDALLRLHAAGSDPRSALPVEFFLYFERAVDAKAAADALRHEGFSVTVEQPDPTAWRVVARRRMQLRLEVLQRHRAELDAMATRWSGEYDGWGLAAD